MLAVHTQGNRVRADTLQLRAVGRPSLDETSLTVMVGLVPAIGRGTVPLLMAGTTPAMTARLVSSRVGSAGGRCQLAMTEKRPLIQCIIDVPQVSSTWKISVARVKPFNAISPRNSVF